MLNSISSVVSKYVWPISVLMLAIVTIASLLPLPVLPEVPGSDKTHHLVSYALIALPVSFIRPKYWLLFVFAVGVWSGIIELLQPFVNRYADWWDLLANVCGLLIGYAISWLVKASIKERVSKC